MWIWKKFFSTFNFDTVFPWECHIVDLVGQSKKRHKLAFFCLQVFFKADYQQSEIVRGSTSFSVVKLCRIVERLRSLFQRRSSRRTSKKNSNLLTWRFRFDLEDVSHRFAYRKKKKEKKKNGEADSNRGQGLASLMASAFCQYAIDVTSFQRALRLTISLIVIYGDDQRPVKIRLLANYRNAFLPRHPPDRFSPPCISGRNFSRRSVPCTLNFRLTIVSPWYDRYEDFR